MKKEKTIVKNSKTRDDYIKEYAQNIKEWGYINSGEVVTRSSDRRTFICENGHERNIIYGALKAVPECPKCKGYISKYTEEMVDKELQTIGMKYISGLTKINNLINIKCHCGAESHGRFYDLMKTKKCAKCNSITYHTIESVTKYFEKNDCKLLEIEYKNTRTPLSFICSCGQKTEKPFEQFIHHPFCKDCGNKNKARGENHPCWNPLLTDEERLKSRKYPEYKEWRLSVYERDNYTCQCCFDNTGGNLEAHHVLNHADHYELRLDVDNGLTLCSICHQDFHMTYGFTDNNREQLNEFLEEFHLELINSI